jgi:biopolymer transport protein ExbD
MKIQLPATSSSDEEFQMAPMIDMVFLLLIFFMVSSKLQQAEFLPIQVPVAKNSEVPKDLGDRRTLTILPGGNGQEPSVVLGLIPQKDMEDLTKHLTADIEKLSKTKRANLRVYLRADANVKHKIVRDVMKACADAGVPNVVFAALQTEAPQ